MNPNKQREIASMNVPTIRIGVGLGGLSRPTNLYIWRRTVMVDLPSSVPRCAEPGS